MARSGLLPFTLLCSATLQAFGDLLCLYEFDEAYFSSEDFYTVRDSTGNTNGCLWSNGYVSVDEAPAFQDGEGRFGSSWNFRGTTAAVRIQPTEASARYGQDAEGGATIALTIRTAADLGDSNHNNRFVVGPNFEMVGTNNDRLRVVLNGASHQLSEVGIYDGGWHTLVLSVAWATGTLRTWIDGVEQPSITLTLDISAELVKRSFLEPWLLGARYTHSSGNTFIGDFDDFAVFSHAFNEDEAGQYHSLGGNSFMGYSVTSSGALAQRSYFLPAGQHPRVLFTSADLPALRERLATSWVAQAAKSNMDEFLELFKEGSSYNVFYTQLLDCGTINAADYPTAESLKVNHDALGEFFEDRDIHTMFMYAAFYALLDEDTATQANLAAALACHSDLYYAIYFPGLGELLNKDAMPALGLAYDFLYNSMTEAQRTSVRRLCAKATKGRTTFGSDKDGPHSGTNWQSHHDLMVLQALAIEGEEGYDPLVYELNVEKMQRFYTWGIFESGFTHEGWLYFAFGQEGAAPVLAASELRGAGLLDSTHLRSVLLGALYQMSPWSSGMGVSIYSFSDGYDPWPGRLNTFIPVMRSLLPDDPVVRFMYQMLVEHVEDRKLSLPYLLWGYDPTPDQSTADFPSLAGSRDLALSRFCPDSGRVIMRSDWSEEALTLHFAARMDTYNLGHMHSDINSFQLFGLRRQWVGDTGYHDTRNDMHSTILIDGLGQVGSGPMYSWPPFPGRFVAFADIGAMAMGVGDASFSYTYWGREHRVCEHLGSESACLGTSEDCRWDEPSGHCVPGWAVGDRAPFEMPTSWANMSKFTYGYNYDGSERDLSDDSQSWRGDHTVCPISSGDGECWGGYYNPVKYAFRTVLLLRGEHPYVLILDNIEAADGLEHDYQITFQMRPSHYLYSRTYGGWEPGRFMEGNVSDSEATLHYDEDPDGPRLLVRLVGREEAGGSLAPMNLSWWGEYQMLSATRKTTRPDFMTVMFPHSPGAPAMATTYNDAEDVLRVEIGSTVDEFYFHTTDAGGRTHFTFSRDGVELFDSSSPASSTHADTLESESSSESPPSEINNETWYGPEQTSTTKRGTVSGSDYLQALQLPLVLLSLTAARQ